MQKFEEHSGGTYQDMQMALTSQAVYIHQHEEIIKRLLSVLSDLSSQIRLLKQEASASNGRIAAIHQERGASPGDVSAMTSEATSPVTNPQGNGSPLQQAQRLMEGYQNLPRPSIQAALDQFTMAPNHQPHHNHHHHPPPHHDQPNGGFEATFPQTDQMLSIGGGAPPTVNHPGQPAGFSGMANTFGGTGQAVAWTNEAQNRPAPARKRSSPNRPHWQQPPRVLLVEDDPTCRRIGCKFLTSAQCMVDVAVRLRKRPPPPPPLLFFLLLCANPRGSTG